jgi:carboxyl-terminal processing protease
MTPAHRRTAHRLASVLLPVLLAACGGDGGGDNGPPPPLSCSVTDQKAWLGGYMDDWYFWYRISPKPDPAPYPSVDEYFNALLYTGTDAAFPADRWSFYESTESFNRFFGDGQSLGYGVSVAGIEVTGRPDLPLIVRYVETLSPAAGNVVRGDQVLSMNGRSAAEIIAAGDYSALTPANPGDTLTLDLRNAGGDRTVVLTAAVFTLTPVSTSAVVTSPAGRKMGYVVVKDMISQAQAPLETAFAQFKAAGISEVVLDLRYNGGGLVSVGSTVASYVAGPLGAGRTYATLLYNDRHAGNNQSFGLANLASAAGVARVFVLTGPRTCSASEQVVNGLRGVGIDVIAIGDTTCGKPVGFLPVSSCGTTYNVVNFESVNERYEGRYFDGFAATCPVADDLDHALGSPAEALLSAARSYADTGQCPAGAGARQMPLSHRSGIRRASEPGERQGMIAR